MSGAGIAGSYVGCFFDIQERRLEPRCSPHFVENDCFYLRKNNPAQGEEWEKLRRLIYGRPVE